MTTQRDIEIVQGQTWTELFLVDGLVSTGNGLRLHIRDHYGATLLRAALAHDNAANERVSFVTGGVLANLGASISTAWDLQGQPVRRWVYSIERYSLTDADDVSVLFMGTCIVKSNPTDESSITKVTPFPSYDESCLRFDVEQSLTEPQKVRVRANAGFPDGGALVSWGGIGGALADQTDLALALAGKSSTSHNHAGTYDPAGTASGAITTHEAASDPHPGYLQNLASSGTSAVIVTVSSDGAALSRSSYTAAQLITAAAAAAPVQSVAGRTGTVTLAVADVSGAEASANKAQANGYASLDSGGKVPQAQIPAIAITEYLGDVASQAAMLALSGQKGDWCTRSDTGTTWIITGTDPTLLGSWTSIAYPASPVTSVAGRTGAVTLSTSDVSGLGTAATLNVPASGNAASGEVVKGSDTRLDVAATVAAATAKTTPVDADVFGIADSAASNVLKNLSWANIKATAKAYFDTLYQAVLVSGTNLKTINSTSLLGSGDIAISASPGGSTTQLQYNNAGAFGGMSGTAWDDTNRAETRMGATVTTSRPVQSFTQTWNAGAVAFTSWLLNVTDTASASTSKLWDVQISGTSKASVNKAGLLTLAGGLFMNGDFQNGSAATIGRFIGITTTSFFSRGDLPIGWSNSAVTWNAGEGLLLYRDADHVLAQRLGTNAQTSRVYGTYTNSSNYVRIATAATSTAATLTAESAGTGAANVDLTVSGAGTGKAILTRAKANGLATALATKTSSYTLTVTDATILADATSAALTMTLPACSTVSGTRYVIKKIDSGGNAVTIDGNASETIDGATTLVLATQWKYAHIQCDGTSWYVIGSN